MIQVKGSSFLLKQNKVNSSPIPLTHTNEVTAMKKVDLGFTRIFDEKKAKMFVLHDSPYFKIINFNFKAGQTLPVHSHDIEGQLSILVLEGTGEFLGSDSSSIPAKAGDVLLSDIATPHGVKALSDMRILVTIAPPI